MTTLTATDIENFWIRCFLNPSDNLREAVIDRAYRDFNRTLHGISKEQTKEKQSQLKLLIAQMVDEVLDTSFSNQVEYDEWHRSKCHLLIEAYTQIANHRIYVGQAQKWINMTLKYLFALGDRRVPNISRNYKYFHFPLDKLIQDEFIKYDVPRFKIAWSRIDDYDHYLEYQKLIRAKFSEQIPLDVEFRLFNETRS